MVPKNMYEIGEDVWQQSYDDDEANAGLNPSGRLWAILNRAALLYLGLFTGISLVLAVVDINLLTHNGAIPKCLLVYVGLAVILALTGGETNPIEKQPQVWLAIYSWRPLRDPSLRSEKER
ncbi:MAG: hypothetical protein H6631_09360 [Anaerolineaceae bacterium]|nr:hypothetical protein [Anaerolineaceae bacterium]